jgi:hypothetical protein
VHSATLDAVADDASEQPQSLVSTSLWSGERFAGDDDAAALPLTGEVAGAAFEAEAPLVAAAACCCCALVEVAAAVALGAGGAPIAHRRESDCWGGRHIRLLIGLEPREEVEAAAGPPAAGLLLRWLLCRRCRAGQKVGEAGRGPGGLAMRACAVVDVCALLHACVAYAWPP